MSLSDQLRMRAYRILNDEHRHSDQAIVWANGLVQSRMRERARQSDLERERNRPAFTLRELSLGATKW